MNRISDALKRLFRSCFQEDQRDVPSIMMSSQDEPNTFSFRRRLDVAKVYNDLLSEAIVLEYVVKYALLHSDDLACVSHVPYDICSTRTKFKRHDSFVVVT